VAIGANRVRSFCGFGTFGTIAKIANEHCVQLRPRSLNRDRGQISERQSLDALGQRTNLGEFHEE
jgi:hypothetical protein